MNLLAQHVGPYPLISLVKSDLWILHPAPGYSSKSFALSRKGVTRINTSEPADGEIAGADLGEEGGGQLGVTDAPPSS